MNSKNITHVQAFTLASTVPIELLNQMQSQITEEIFLGTEIHVLRNTLKELFHAGAS